MRLSRPSPARFAVALVLAVSGGGAAHAQAAADVPVERVVLFASGVGYFEHGGRIAGDADVTLRFDPDALNDVLKSLVVEDRGGRVAGVVYPTPRPLGESLGSFAVDLSAAPDLTAILAQLRGAEVSVETPEGTVRGTILAVGRETRASEGAALGVDVLSLVTARGIESVRLDTARRVEFADPALRADLADALAVVAGARSGDRRPVRVQFRGTAPRRVRMGYVVASPVWKTSYRLLLGEASAGTLQGWALVENPTEADWTDVDLTLVSGRPVSFVLDLYSPRYVDRPTVALPDDQAVRPVSYSEGVGRGATPSVRGGRAEVVAERPLIQRDAIGAPPAAPVAPPPPPPPLDPTAGVSAMGSAGDVGELFAYRLGSVTLPRRGSAMLPIVSGAVGAERLSIYSGTSRHPMRGVRFTNTTGAALRGGPVTVLDDGSYGGDALLPDLPPGQSRLLGFALDQDVLVDPFVRPNQASRVETATLTDGVLLLQVQARTTRGYRLENRGARDRVVLVEHPRETAARLLAPTAAEESTPGLYRFRVALAPGAVDSLVVVEARILREAVALSDISPDQLRRYATADGEMPDSVRRALREAIAAREALAETERQVAALQQERRTIEQDQARIRGNLQAVDAQTDYARRLLAQLNTQEDRLDAIRAELERLEARATGQRDALRVSVRP